MAYGEGKLWRRPRAGGKWVWEYQWYFHGVQVSRVVGPARPPTNRHAEGMSEREAWARARVIRAEVEMELEAGAVRQARSASTSTSDAAPRQHVGSTLNEVAEIRFTKLSRKGRKENTLDDYRSMVRCHISAFFGDKEVSRITTEDVEAFVDFMHDLDRSPGTILKYLNVLHGIFKTAIHRGLVASNPVERIDNRPDTEEDGIIHYLHRREIEALIRAEQEDDLGKTMRAIYAVATMTGLRQGELLALRWCQR